MIGRIHPSWFVPIACVIGYFMTTPGQTIGVSSFIDHIARDLSIPREQVLMLYSVGTLIGILPAPYIGRLLDRYGPRRAIGFIVIALGLSCGALAWADGPWGLALGFTLLRGTAIGGLSLVCGHLINLWFDRYRGRSAAIAMLGMALGGLIVPGVAEGLTSAYGWRDAYLVLGVGVVAIMLPVGLLLFRNHPGIYGLLPDFGKTAAAPSAHDIPGPTLREAQRTLVFWYLLAIGILVNAVGTALLLDHIRGLQAAGLSRETAIAMLGMVTVVQSIAFLGGGVLVDRYGSRRTGLLGLLLLATSVVCMMTATGLLAGAAYAAALGASLGVLHVVGGAGYAEHFGTLHLGNIKGTASMVGIFGAAAGPLPLALWSPGTSYWIFLAAIAAALALGVSASRRPLIVPIAM